MKRLIQSAVITFLFFSAAISYNYYVNTVPQTGYYSSLISNHLHDQEKEVNDLFDETDFIEGLILSSFEYKKQSIQVKDNNRLENLYEKPYTILIFKQDSLLFWSNNSSPFPHLDNINATIERSYNFSSIEKNGSEVVLQKYKSDLIGEYTICGLIPIKVDSFDIKAPSHSTFPASKRIPKEITLSEQTSDYPVINSKGVTLCYLSSPDIIIDKTQTRNKLCLYLFAFIALAFFLNNTEKLITERTNDIFSSCFLILSVIGIRSLSIFLDLSDKYSSLPIFNPKIGAVGNSSIGDFLINALLILWLTIFLEKKSSSLTLRKLTKREGFILSTLNYFSILVGILLLFNVIKALIFSNLTFDFDNIFDLAPLSLLAISGLILIIFSAFIFSYAMISNIVKIGLDKNQRLVCLLVASGISLPIILSINGSMISPTYLILITVIYVLLFDLFSEGNQQNFTWLVIWIIIVAAIPSMLLHKYNSYKDLILTTDFAKELEEEVQYEESFSLLSQKLEIDKELYNTIQQFPQIFDQEKTSHHINDFIKTDTLLNNNFNSSIYYFDQYGNNLLNNNENAIKLRNFDLAQASLIENRSLKIFTNSNNQKSYYLNKKFNNDLSFIIEFTPKSSRSISFKNFLNKYDFAIYKNNQRIDSRHNNFENTLTLQDLPKKTITKSFQQDDYLDIIYNSPNDIIIRIRKDTKNDYLSAITLFSYIILMLVLFIILFLFLNSFLNISPSFLEFSVSQKPSLKTKIQLSMVSTTILSFIIIGIITVWFFQNSSKAYHQNKIKDKLNQVKSLEMLSDYTTNDSLRNNIETTLSNLKIYGQSQIDDININFYNLRGDLIDPLKKSALIKKKSSLKMNALAFKTLQNQPQFIHEVKQSNGLPFRTGYIPFKIDKKTTVFLEVQFHSKGGDIKNDIAIFMGTLLNVYIFLFLIVAGVAIAIAQSITAPLVKIGEKIKQFQIGKANKFLEWKNQDEIGSLINEFNKMILKVEESASQLMQAERESVYQEIELAKQQEFTEQLLRNTIPYICGVPIKDPNQFYGRKKILNRIKDTILTTNYAIVGDYRIGKTSIQFQIKELLETINDPKYLFLPVFVDLQHLGGQYDNFFHFLGKYLIQLAKNKSIPVDILTNLRVNQVSKEDYDSLEFKEDLETLIEFWEEEFSPKEPIVVFQIDEVNLMSQFDPNILVAFRAIMVDNRQFKTILSGKYLFKDSDSAEISPWWNLYKEINIDAFDYETATELIQKPVEGIFNFSKEAIDQIIKTTGTKPLELQHFCTNVLLYKYQQKPIDRNISIDDIIASIEYNKSKSEDEK